MNKAINLCIKGNRGVTIQLLLQSQTAGFSILFVPSKNEYVYFNIIYLFPSECVQNIKQSYEHRQFEFKGSLCNMNLEQFGCTLCCLGRNFILIKMVGHQLLHISKGMQLHLRTNLDSHQIFVSNVLIETNFLICKEHFVPL